MTENTRKTSKLRSSVKMPEVSPEDTIKLKTIGDGIQSLGRRTTEQSFELGSYLAEAKAILPERALGTWVKAICKFTPKSARNYIAIHEHLAHQKERLIATRVAPTTLFVLAYADKEKVDEVVAAFEAGQDLSVAEVKTMVGTPPTKKATRGVLDQGGILGLRGIAQLKLEQDATRFLTLMKDILAQVEKVVKPAAGKGAHPKGSVRRGNIGKGALQEAIVTNCRHAHDLINSIAAPLQPSMAVNVGLRPAKLPEGSNWQRVQSLLLTMGESASWPGKSDIVFWLENEVIPLLRFVVHGEPVANGQMSEHAGGLGIELPEPIDQAVDEELLAYDDMPPRVQATIDAALEIVEPDAREEIKALVMFDPKPKPTLTPLERLTF
ncbi:hypothetical protein ACLE20_08880 [Rhizobium sp. YIM 134829]|uniref:hypothetical protein n=1 Tax=Rhizobium sp. YIM 134829 TaxID=3390453 RepID=UPI00397C2E6F